MALLFDLDEVVANRYIDSEFTIRVGHDCVAILRCHSAIDIKIGSFHGDGGVVVVSHTAHLER